MEKSEIFRLMNERLDELEYLLKVQAEELRKLRLDHDNFKTKNLIAMAKCRRLEAALIAARSSQLPISHIPGRLVGVDFSALENSVRRR